MKEKNNELGFTLVEITLAMLVVAVGVLAVFGLMGDALKANTKTLDDTIAATFAESVFNSIYAADWDDTSYSILMAQADKSKFWTTNTVVNIELCSDNKDFKKNKYSYNSIDYYPITYNLQIEHEKSPPDFRPKKPSAGDSPGNDTVWRSFRLKVWIGEFADTGSKSDPYSFYTEQYRFIDPKKEYEGGGD